jgi:hypothetical protein
MVELWGAGGGGGSGRRYVAGNPGAGGGGAGGGAYGYRLFKASDLGATEAVTIGAGGAGGAAVTADTTNGASGTAGGDSAFGAWLTMYGGNPGAGGDPSSGGGGPGGGVLSSSGQPAVIDSFRDGHFGRGGPSGTASGFGGGYGGNSPSPGGSSYQGGPAGGGGGIINSNNTYQPPGSGGGIVNQSGSGAVRGAYPGTAGASGTGRQGGAGGTVGSVTVDSCVDVTFGNATFAGVSSGGFIWTSSNGTNNWVAQTGPSNLPVTRLMHDGTQFVLFDTSSRVWTTTDFSTYTARANGPWTGGLYTKSTLPEWPLFCGAVHLKRRIYLHRFGDVDSSYVRQRQFNLRHLLERHKLRGGVWCPASRSVFLRPCDVEHRDRRWRTNYFLHLHVQRVGHGGD